MTKAKKRAPAKSAQSSPSAQKKTPQRGSKRAKSPRRVLRRIRNHEKYLDYLATTGADAKRIVDDIRAAREENDDKLLGLFLPSEPIAPATTPADAEAARRQYAGRALDRTIEELNQLLRTELEPDPVLIPRLVEAIERSVAMLGEAAHAVGADHQDKLAEALIPAARAAAALTKFVNGPCAELAPNAHAAGRGASDCWPRIHYANARRNTETEEVFRSWKIGADLPRKPAKQDRQTRNAVARDRTLTSLCQLLPETMRRCYPVLPLLFDNDEKPIAPRTKNGTLARPYKALAEFIVTVRHSETAEPRAKALRDFLAANDAAAARLPKMAQLRTEYAKTRRRLAREVKRVNSKPKNGNAKAPPAPAWLRRTTPLIAFASSSKNRTGSRNKSDILRAQNLLILADALAPIYSRMIAELDARDALKTVIDRRITVTGKGKTGPKSAAADYIQPHLSNLPRLLSLTETELREIADAARAETQKLK